MSTKTILRNAFAGLAVAAAIGTGAALHSGPSTANANPTIPVDGTIADVAEKTFDSVVSIEVRMGGSDVISTDDDDADMPRQRGKRGQVGKGSGVIVTATGRILTNAHVVDGATDIKVTLTDGTEYDAKVVGKDLKGDVAVIQIKGSVSGLKPIAFGDSSKVRLGDVVLAIGDGLGVGKSVSMGIVSAKGRNGMGIENYEDFIQTDAAINHGNSGGALVNMKGELIGINTAIASRTGEYSGIGFAIPTSMARPIMDMLVQDGRVSRGYLGVGLDTVTSQMARENHLGTSRGAVITGVQPDSPAAKAGLVEGDVIVGIDGTDIRNDTTLRNTIAMIRPGSSVKLEIVHQQKGRETIKATLGELPEAQPATLRKRR